MRKTFCQEERKTEDILWHDARGEYRK